MRWPERAKPKRQPSHQAAIEWEIARLRYHVFGFWKRRFANLLEQAIDDLWIGKGASRIRGFDDVTFCSHHETHQHHAREAVIAAKASFVTGAEF